MGPWFSFLTDQFVRLTIPSNLTNPQNFNKSRDELRGLLSQHDPHMFPPPGLHHTSVFQNFKVFERNSHRNFTLQQNFTCTGGCQMQHEVLYLPNACNSGSWINAARRTNFSCTLECVYLCQEGYKNSALFAQFLLSFLTYVLLSYFIHLHCANTHTPLPFLSYPYDFQNMKTRHSNLFCAKDTYRTTRLQVLVIIILRAWFCTLFPQMRSLCTVWGFNAIKTSQLVD